MAALERKLFEERFNKLIDAIHRFSDEYNKSKGDVWPARQPNSSSGLLRT